MLRTFILVNSHRRFGGTCCEYILEDLNIHLMSLLKPHISIVLHAGFVQLDVTAVRLQAADKLDRFVPHRSELMLQHCRICLFIFCLFNDDINH
jgi:hypothetical protein